MFQIKKNDFFGTESFMSFYLQPTNSNSALLWNLINVTSLVPNWRRKSTLWWPSTSETVPQNTGINFFYAKTQDCSILHSPTNKVPYSVWNNLLVKTASHRNQSINLLHKSIYWFLYDITSHQKLFVNIL